MEENSLRLILFLVGIVILLGIYFYDVLQKKRTDEVEEFIVPDREERVEPVMSGEPTFSAVFESQEEVNSAENPVEQDEPEVLSAENSTPEVVQEDIPVAVQSPVIQLAVLSKKGGAFLGATLLDAFTQLNLEFGDMGIFHRYERQDGVEIQQFHVANILEPGTFPVGSMADFESTGIVLFFQANDAVNPEEAFEDMLEVARQLSQRLDARLVDGEMNELMPEKILHIQAQLAALKP